MRSPATSGVSAIVIGILSMIVGSTVRHYETLLGTDAGGYLLRALDRLGLVRVAPAEAGVEWSPSGLFFPLTDANVLRGFLIYGAYLALASLLLAIWAEYCREENLYLSAGFMCGAGGLYLASPLFGIVAISLGAATLLVLQKRRRHEHSTSR
ncbi:MAG TPA: hypothetical protein VGM81_24870 [Burkholderiaceae bacterium]|jgi:hypothetical protein